ncbi:LA_3751/LA_3752 family putative glycosyltransferase [Leptospira sarikeiensis]|uniref:Glycosyltransferase RgtA/B/C/D-like domain-containing protein n=1 Tax=Leptospira sarikeiensis TaxID=2484943 RepID=A0A4R9K7J5_9LEPT|nr:hypothetical protein [Leptospira sarikeiensis]TGL61627.1 hypothetical protein EHQ64_09670 [Leptospira sarikeiensis]
MDANRINKYLPHSQILFLFVCFLFTALFILKIDPNSILVADNQNKIFQAQAFLDSGYGSQYASCKILSDLGGCEFFPSWKIRLKDGISGPFPVAFSLFASLFGLLGDYSLLFYVSILFFWIGIFFLKIRTDLKWIGVLFLGLGPAFFHSALFPDYSITFLLTCFGLCIYYKPASNKYLNLFSGFLVGLGFFFRPENTILFSFLGVFHLYEYIRDRSRISEIDRSRLYQLMASGVAVVFYGFINYSLYGSPFGTRIQSNWGLAWEIGLLKYASLLFWGNGRVGFLAFCPWVLLWLAYLLYRWKDLENTEKKLLLSTLLSLVFATVFSPNDSNIDWGTRYLSWITVPAVLLFFNGKRSDTIPKYMKILTGLLFIQTLFFSRAYFILQEKLSHEFVKYNQFLLDSGSDIYITNSLRLSALFGQEIFSKKVLIIKQSKSISKISELLSRKKGSVSIIRYNDETSSFVLSLENPQAIDLDLLLEKELIRNGWELVSKNSLEKIEILKFIRK